MDTALIEPPARRHRRRHSAAFKAELVKACQQPGVSSAAVALANGVNANLVRRWVNAAERGELSLRLPKVQPASKPSLEFVPLQLTASTEQGTTVPQADIRIELHRAGLNVSVSWPTQAAAECATWLREILR